MDESYKSDPEPLDEGPRSKSGKSRLNLHGRKINWFRSTTPPKKKKELKRRAYDLKNQDAS